MAFCTNCGAELKGQYCSACGTKEPFEGPAERADLRKASLVDAEPRGDSVDSGSETPATRPANEKSRNKIAALAWLVGLPLTAWLLASVSPGLALTLTIATFLLGVLGVCWPIKRIGLPNRIVALLAVVGAGTGMVLVGQQIQKEIVVRRAAVLKLTDQATLARIAVADKHSVVREAAVLKLTDQATLAKIAVEDKHSDVREAAVLKLTD